MYLLVVTLLVWRINNSELKTLIFKYLITAMKIFKIKYELFSQN